MKTVISFLVTVLILFPSFAFACGEKASTNLEPFLKFFSKVKKTDACNDFFLYVPIIYNNQKIFGLNLKFGKSIKNSVVLSFFDPTGDEHIGKEGYVLANICLSQDMLEDAEVIFMYKPEPTADGAISFCMSTREYELKNL